MHADIYSQREKDQGHDRHHPHNPLDLPGLTAIVGIRCHCSPASGTEKQGFIAGIIAGLSKDFKLKSLKKGSTQVTFLEIKLEMKTIFL